MRDKRERGVRGSMILCIMELEMAGMKSHPNGGTMREKECGVLVLSLREKMKLEEWYGGRVKDQ
jgi:hypothetical protein